jgi:dienelactone hydrolase
MAAPALAQNPLDIPAVATIFHTNSAGNRLTGAPLLVLLGTADQFVQPIVIDAFAAKACAAGDTVDYRLVAGASHGGELDDTVDDVAAWFADRINGVPAPSTCSQG